VLLTRREVAKRTKAFVSRGPDVPLQPPGPASPK
jgi:hypothetical protein